MISVGALAGSFPPPYSFHGLPSRELADPTESADTAPGPGGSPLIPCDSPGAVGVNDTAAPANAHLVLASRSPVRPGLGPLEFLRQCRNLGVDYVDPETGGRGSMRADVHLYINNGIDERVSNLAERRRIQSRVRRMARRYAAGASTRVAADRRVHNVAIQFCISERARQSIIVFT